MKPYPKLPAKEKKPRVQIKRTPLKKKYKVTGEKKIFLEIWNERLHLCEQCSEPIMYFSPSNFHHIKRKGKYPELRLEKGNIILACFDCHYNIHNK